ncbi:MAG: hypothetical protein HZB39_16565 [Planctomycetes bacterium]|nr:hypothetical protein [Planctomycetota bacterium]
MRSLPILSLAFVFLVAGVRAQDDPYAKDEQALAKSAATKLITYAKLAERNKVFSRAKEAYELVVRNYEPENLVALRALGYQKEGGEWKAPKEGKRWPDDANDEKRFEVIGEWRRFAEAVCRLHRELGLKMLKDVPGRAVGHFEMALYYNPHDVDSHKALEHGEWEGFWGTPEEIAFVQRMRELEQKAAELSKAEYPFEVVAEIPKELKAMLAEDGEIEFYGAKSDSFTVFTRGTQQNAIDCVMWAERACDFLEFCMPEAKRRSVDIRKHFKRVLNWYAFIWTNAEQKAFIRLNPHVNGTENFVNVAWHENGRLCEVTRALTPVAMHDHLVASVFHMLGGNGPTNEGLMHAATWYLRATAITRHGAIGTETTTGDRRELPDSATWWMREVRDQAIGSTDFPLNGVPRVQFSSFNPSARIKTWSFSVWLLARYPGKWMDLLSALPDESKRPFPEVVDEVYQKVFDRPREEIEAEWRGWAAGRSLVAEFTGYGPPLLPEKPNDDQIKGLMRLNEFRDLLDLPDCEIDLESTVACRDHALFLLQNPDHWQWPEAHEEDPAKAGFTVRGMRAGLNSVIVISPSGGHIDPADSLDGWIGTVYHRFPLLEPNIKRIGFAAEGAVVVLDMGSLEEAVDPESAEKFKWVQWPPDGMEGVPLSFHANEYPDPMADTKEGKAEKDPERLQQEAGYPVSMQFGRGVANQLDDASMVLFRCKRRGREYERDEVVPTWLHTPKSPLLKRMENPSVVFVIPKQTLEANTTYEVVATLKTPRGDQEEKWHFTTGSSRRGHGKLKVPERKQPKQPEPKPSEPKKG